MFETTENDAWLKLETIEREICVDSWQIEGVYHWKLMRPKIYEKYLEKIALGGALRPPKIDFRRFLSKSIPFFLHCIIANPYLRPQKRGLPLLIGSEREIVVRGELIDSTIDRDSLREHLSKTHTLFTSRGRWEHISGGQSANSLPLALGRFFALFLTVKLSGKDLLKLRMVAQDILNFGEHKRDGESPSRLLTRETKLLARIVARETAIFRGERKAYDLLYRITRPCCLYVVAGYARASAIDAATAMNVKVYEFQHGISGRTHYGYDFRFWREVPYFPDVFLAWGNSWIDAGVFPKRCEIQIAGQTSTHAKLRELRSSQGPEKHLLVVSQGIRSEQTIRLVLEFLKIRSDWKALVKPHPKDEYFAQILTNASQELRDESLRVHHGDLFSAFAQVELVIGENSTSLVEALLAGKKVILFRGKYKIMEDLYNKGYATVVETPEGLAKAVDNFLPSNVDDYFSEPIFVPQCCTSHKKDPPRKKSS